jgi:DNA helicase-2/ATP-dependent DNA helicase PcrA
MTRAKEHPYLIQALRFFRTQQHRFGNGHIIAPRSRFLPDDIYTVYPDGPSMPTPVGDTLAPQAAASIDIGAHLLGM